jgi:hypothetical protein
MAWIRRHASGDWGEATDEDTREQSCSVTHSFRPLRAYRTAHGEQIWVITAADRLAPRCCRRHTTYARAGTGARSPARPIAAWP